ncbi:MAG: pyruvate kinase [Candidatus Omnitrophica bacterium]|nr:pyruvate kinase [Candidatus Omnitrophota bacterium]
MVKTKIIATVGPASADLTVLRRMMLAGLDVIRLNFSHGRHKEHQDKIDIIRKLNKKYRRHIKILQDLEGYRVRIGKFIGKSKIIELKKKQTAIITNKDSLMDKGIISIDYEGPLTDIKIGTHIFIDDGNIALRVKQRSKYRIKTEVVVEGILKENKGVNIPDLKLRFQDLTKKDSFDLKFGIKNKVDFIAQSFVRSKKDLINIKKALGDCKSKIIAKIENKDGIKNIDEIIDLADGIMIARGDMGVSLPIFKVPMIQKMIIKKCNKKKKFVITATQMLESMTEHLRPTRAEVSDVANAILDGTDYVMLSGETAMGDYPRETVKMMNDIIKYTEPFI